LLPKGPEYRPADRDEVGRTIIIRSRRSRLTTLALVTSDGFPVLWLCGPPGVGKTSVGWEIFGQLERSGTKTAYVDIDQLGMSLPAAASDPNGCEIKMRNLQAVLDSFALSGARCAIVTGTVGAAREEYARLGGVDLTVCRLSVGDHELRCRLDEREWDSELVEESLAEAAQLDASDFAELAVQTDGRSVGEVARLVRKKAEGWPPPVALASVLARVPRTPPARQSATPGRILWVCGPAGVGKSTVAWQLLMDADGRDIPLAYVDLAQLGFLRPVENEDALNHRLRAANVAKVWAGFQAAGAPSLVISGRVSRAAEWVLYADALAPADITVCRLRAGHASLQARLLERGRGGGPRIPGDELAGLSAAALARVLERSAAEGAELDEAAFGDLVVDTDDRSVEAIAAEVCYRTGFLSSVP